MRNELESYKIKTHKDPNEALKDLVGIIFRAGKESMPLKKTGIIRDQYREELEPKETVAKADMKSFKEQKRVFA